MDKKLRDAFNTQIKNELASGYLYLSMAAFCDSISMEGSAKWFKVQAQEEVGHAMKMYDFLYDRGEKVVLDALPKPETDFDSVADTFARTLAHEKKVTAMINSLYDLSRKSDDKAAEVFLQWFITEQVEEEKNATVIIEKLKMVKPDSGGMLMLDKQLGKRGEEKD